MKKAPARKGASRGRRRSAEVHDEDACPPSANSPSAPKADACSPSSPDKTDIQYWKQRLIQSAHGKLARWRSFHELSSRIEHDGRSFFFPLGTDAKDVAAARALEIYREALTRGWTVVLKRCSREFTLAIFWAENPMVFTYTTLYSVVESQDARQQAPSQPTGQPQPITVAVIESDNACGRALAQWVGRLPDCQCAGVFTTEMAALLAMKRQPVDLVLFNRQLNDLAAGELVKNFQAAAPGTAAFGYRIYDGSDELFVSQPGLSGGYYFRRRPPEDLLEPISGAWLERPQTQAEWLAHIFGYVQKLFRFPPETEAGRDASTLTSRERDILACLCKGSPDKGIARALNISAWTVHTHLKKIYEKLGAHSRTEAVVKYLQK